MAHKQISDKNTTMSFVIPKELKEKAFEIATKENRSCSNLIVDLLNNYVMMYNQKERLLMYQQLISEIKGDTK